MFQMARRQDPVLDHSVYKVLGLCAVLLAKLGPMHKMCSDISILAYSSMKDNIYLMAESFSVSLFREIVFYQEPYKGIYVFYVSEGKNNLQSTTNSNTTPVWYLH